MRAPSRWILVAAMTALIGCEADPLPPEDPEPVADMSATPEPDAPPCPDADGDGAKDDACASDEPDCNDGDDSIYPGAPDPCGDGIDQNCDGEDPVCPPDCTPQPVDPCDAIDDDCDGLVDECSGDRVCDGGACVSPVGAPCDAAVPCAVGLDCVDGLCTAPEPGGLCEDTADCGPDAVCAVNEGCDPAAEQRCYALQGGRCAFDCDCTGLWLCDDARGRCVTCLNDGQCDSGVCTAGGLCAARTTVPADVDALGALMHTVLDCWTRGIDQSDALGCAQLRTTALEFDERPVDAIAPIDDGDPRLCDLDSIERRGLSPDNARAIAELFGCLDAPRRVRWEAAVPADSDPAGCIAYVPAWGDQAAGSAQVVIADCGELVFSRP